MYCKRHIWCASGLGLQIRIPVMFLCKPDMHMPWWKISEMCMGGAVMLHLSCTETAPEAAGKREKNKKTSSYFTWNVWLSHSRCGSVCLTNDVFLQGEGNRLSQHFQDLSLIEKEILDSLSLTSGSFCGLNGSILKPKALNTVMSWCLRVRSTWRVSNIFVEWSSLYDARTNQKSLS